MSHRNRSRCLGRASPQSRPPSPPSLRGQQRTPTSPGHPAPRPRPRTPRYRRPELPLACRRPRPSLPIVPEMRTVPATSLTQRRTAHTARPSTADGWPPPSLTAIGPSWGSPQYFSQASSAGPSELEIVIRIRTDRPHAVALTLTVAVVVPVMPAAGPLDVTVVGLRPGQDRLAPVLEHLGHGALEVDRVFGEHEAHRAIDRMNRSFDADDVDDRQR